MFMRDACGNIHYFIIQTFLQADFLSFMWVPSLYPYFFSKNWINKIESDVLSLGS